MANNTPITIIGNLGSDPELRFTPSGLAVINFSVAVTPRVRTADGEWEDGDPAWFRCTAWRDMAENIAASFGKGDRVIVHGDLVQRVWQDNDGNDHVSVEVNVEECGHTLRFGTTEYTRGGNQDAKSDARDRADDRQSNSRNRRRSSRR